MWIVQKNNPIEAPVSIKSQKTQTSQPKDETANWQTYRNEKYGFEFKYPNNFLYDEDIAGSENTLYSITFGLPYKEVFGEEHPNYKTAQGIEFIINKKASNLENFIQDDKGAVVGVEDSTEKLGETRVLNFPAQIMKYCNMGGYCDKAIYFTDNRYIYSIKYPISDSVIDQKIFNQILSTFKFTN